MKTLNILVAILLVIGGLNWGLVGLFEFNLVEFITGHSAPISRTIYVVVGLAAVYKICRWISCRGCCSGSSCK